jgi:hypothetical protein
MALIMTKSDSKAGIKKPGQPGRKFTSVPDDAMRPRITELSRLGIPVEQIAHVACMTRDNLYKHYRHDMMTGRLLSNELVGSVLLEKATVDKDTAALIFWAKTQMGWKETKAHEITGKDGDAVAFKEIKRTIVKAPNVEDNA